MELRDKYGYPVERVKGRYITNFIRLLTHTSIKQTWIRRNIEDIMNKTEKAKLNKIYEELKKKQLSSGDGAETYTTGYRNGHTNGQIELLERILAIDTGLRSEDK